MADVFNLHLKHKGEDPAMMSELEIQFPNNYACPELKLEWTLNDFHKKYDDPKWQGRFISQRKRAGAVSKQIELELAFDKGKVSAVSSTI